MTCGHPTLILKLAEISNSALCGPIIFIWTVTILRQKLPDALPEEALEFDNKTSVLL